MKSEPLPNECLSELYRQQSEAVLVYEMDLTYRNFQILLAHAQAAEAAFTGERVVH